MPRAASLLTLAALALPACGSYRPPRFADAPAFLRLADRAPIALPARHDPLEAIYLSNAYVRRPVIEALDPRRTPEAGDINALDDALRSSFFDPTEPREIAGPPVAPFAVISDVTSSGLDGLAISDARGLRYELLRDTQSRPALRSAAIAIASRLLGALGYLTPEAYVLSISPRDLVPIQRRTLPAHIKAFLQAGPPPEDERYRVAAIRWPVGIDVGATPANGVRDDDPNDRIEHKDRRVLRALSAAFFWVGASDLEPGTLRDSYLGAPGHGHLLHWIVRLDGALGADATRTPSETAAHGEPLAALFTLGIYRPRRLPVQTRWLSLGDFDERASFAGFSLSPPFAPAHRALPGDLYWIAKRISSVSDEQIAAAVDAAHMRDRSAAARARDVLAARRVVVAKYAFSRVTPCEIEGVSENELVLRDEAIVHGFAAAARSHYARRYLDDEGSAAAEPSRAAPEGARVRVPLPPTHRDYLVVQVRAERDGEAPPRAMEIHIVRDAKGARVVGVRH